MEHEDTCTRGPTTGADEAAERLHRLWLERSEELRAACGLDWLGRLVAGGTRPDDRRENPMHLALTEGTLTDGEFTRFLAAYYWGSHHRLADAAAPGTAGNEDNAWYREYIKTLIVQEDGPDGRRGILKRYLESLEYEPGDAPDAAAAFAERAAEGYRADLGQAIGYALAVEMESDFQLSLIAAALTARFPRALAETVYSDLLLDTGREAERARSLCAAIEGLLASHEIARRDVECGFLRAVADAGEFMLGTYQELKGDAPATQIW